MTEEETQNLLDEASGFYNDGRYDEAIAVWNSILKEDPEHERAAEGIKMVSLLTSDWEPAGASEAAGAGGDLDPELLARVEEGVQRVEQLLAAGDLDAAREGVEALEQIAPDHPGVQACSARIEAAANPSEYVEEQLAMARHYLMIGDMEEATASARKVMAVDPANATATEILSNALASEPAPAPADAPPLELSLEPEAPVLDLPVDVAEPEPPSAPPSAAVDPKIAQLLAEGDQLQGQGKLHEAIDAWSRVFIIEDSNSDAEQRIDGARRALEDQARQMEEGLIRATDLEKEGRLEEARGELQAVLGIRPGHAEAQGMLEKVQARIDAGEEEVEAIPLEATDEVPAAEEPVAPAGAPPVPPPPPELPQFPVDADDSGEAQTPTPPPKPPERERAVRTPAPKRSGALVAVVALISVTVLGYGGWLAYQAFFPSVPMDDLSAGIPPAGDAEQNAGPADGGGGGESAVAPGVGGVEPAGEPAGPPEPEPAQPVVSPGAAGARSAELLQSGIRQFEAGNYEAAVAQFQEAVKLDSANFDAQDWRDKAQAEVGKAALFGEEMVSIQNLVDERDFHNALYKLYRVEPSDDIQQRRTDSWIASCWHDWGVLLLRAGNPGQAVEKLQEALKARPDDAEAVKHLEVARRYSRRAVDDSYRTYVSRLELRGLN